LSNDPKTLPSENRYKDWDELRREFEDSKGAILALRLETEEEGRERAKRDPRGGASRQDREEERVVRFTSGQDIENLGHYLQAARGAIPDLETMFSAAAPTREFFVTWGAFQLSYGLVMGSCFRSGDAFEEYRKSVRAYTAKQ
jgi:hypothetical protein